jgi:hypothetical protein
MEREVQVVFMSRKANDDKQEVTPVGMQECWATTSLERKRLEVILS